MKTTFAIAVSLMIVALISSPASRSAEREGLILTETGVANIRSALGKVPLFDATLNRVRAEVDAEMEVGIDTPIPKDLSGGYTHERHKRNYLIIRKAGILFRILGDTRYAAYVRDMLFQYEAIYGQLPVHPQTRSYARGKLFWQCLNDANWLVYVSQAYDAIHDWLSEEERSRLEDNLFRPFADFLSVENPRFFNRVHNHSTWGNAAVGMIGLVMRDDELVQRALYGMDDDGLASDEKDDDGGFIRVQGQAVGFLANLQEPFSPDGYYTEGPYYQRYAMYPFLVFAQALHNVKPELKIFEQQDGVLLKAVDTLLNLSDADGEFFPLNDAQKGMSFHARELVTAVDIAYHLGGKNPQLLSIAREQGRVLLDDSGFSVALDIRDGKARPFRKKSANYSDGADGKQGGLAVLRYGDDDLTLVFKYSAQGLSHGHYDKLSFSLYEKGDEVFQDYGMVRFVNIGQKGGGNYLEENNTWAKQTIAHNTITQNETSHFQGSYDLGSRHHSSLHFFDAARGDIQVASASDTNAYPGTEMRRTLAIIKNANLEKPFVLDIFKVTSDKENQYDLPFYFFGQPMDMDFEYEVPSILSALGEKNGYQHLYLEAKGKPSGDRARLSWLDKGRFYTLTSVTEATDDLLLTRLGAGDPAFNLRRDPAFMLRRKAPGDTVFVTVLEPHGSYSPVSELAVNTSSSIAGLQVIHDDTNHTAVSMEDLTGQTSVFILSNTDPSPSAEHRLTIGGNSYQWVGPYHYVASRLPGLGD